MLHIIFINFLDEMHQNPNVLSDLFNFVVEDSKAHLIMEKLRLVIPKCYPEIQDLKQEC